MSSTGTHHPALTGKRWPDWRLWLAALLCSIWPMAHSVALRNTVLAILIAAGMQLLRKQQQGYLLPVALRRPAHIYLLLSIWLLVTVTFSDSILNALSQYRGEWLMAFVALLAGLLLAGQANRGGQSGMTRDHLLNGINLGLAIPCLIQIGYAVFVFLQQQTLPLWDVPLFGRTSLSFVHNILYGMLLADALARSSGRKPLLPFSGPMLGAAFGLSFFCTYLLNTRNGTVSVMLMTLFATLLAWYQHRRQINNYLLLLLTSVLLLAMGVYAKLAFEAEPRWAAFGESTRLAWNTEHQKAWLDDRIPLPRMSNGQAVDHSAYMRLAWFKEGSLAILDYPFGVGFGRNAYGHAMKRKYGFGTGHSHSSLIDFTLSGGIPGLLLWMALCGSLLHLGWQSYFRCGDVVGMALLMLVSGTLLRMVVDSNLRDHGLEQFLFLAAVLASTAAHGLRIQRPPTPSSQESGRYEPN